jgi:hypothetical protein
MIVVADSGPLGSTFRREGKSDSVRPTPTGVRTNGAARAPAINQSDTEGKELNTSVEHDDWTPVGGTRERRRDARYTKATPRRGRLSWRRYP